MSLNVPPRRLGKTLRLRKIKEMYPRHASHQAIADACGVNEKTIDRDIDAWRKSGGLEEWLREEFFDLHETMKSMEEKAPLAYTTVAQLLGKTLTQKVEQKTEGSEEVRIIIEDNAIADDKVETTPRPEPDPQKQI